MEPYKYRIKIAGNFEEKKLKYLLEKMSITVNSSKTIRLKEESLFLGWIELESDHKLLENSIFQHGLKEFKEKFSVDIETKKVNKKNMAIFVSNQGHCLKEVLTRWEKGELDCNIPLVISDHDTYRKYVESYGIEFYNLKLTKRDKKTEQKALHILDSENIDFISLARYMQVLPSEFVSIYSNNIINIHHSLLPAFVGANTYQRAFDRGVKVIGSTAHYVTEELDEGPILIQKAINIDEGLGLKDYKNFIRMTETETLIDAIRYHINDKVLVYNNKAVLLK
ncbi:formyltetrahydrofolate deformylase [Sediminibacillus albus]|uniref:Formyltetrahydrofolate deformylase n=1 Tax=Sediminibacillus albus TaxID=407036 RepID=A0A1G8YEC1_9BACI|nr:formyltetrahydrofolate deformylase [Sediminibacillus albus]SDK00390.1 formyltetrahydrofolate deformylase [Sediminibacillus albus]